MQCVGNQPRVAVLTKATCREADAAVLTGASWKLQQQPVVQQAQLLWNAPWQLEVEQPVALQVLLIKNCTVAANTAVCCAAEAAILDCTMAAIEVEKPTWRHCGFPQLTRRSFLPHCFSPFLAPAYTAWECCKRHLCGMCVYVFM